MREGAINRRLYKDGDQVFHQLPGFKGCSYLRRVRCPARRGSDVDFLLFKKGKRPLLGIVECEGPDKGYPAGVEQLKRYVAGFRGGGKAIYRESIKDAFDASKKRGRVNASRWRDLASWKAELGMDTEELEAQLGRATIVPILLYYRTDNLSAQEKRSLSQTFRQHDFIAAVAGTHARDWRVRTRTFTR
jgi:hypothetical protein